MQKSLESTWTESTKVNDEILLKIEKTNKDYLMSTRVNKVKGSKIMLQRRSQPRGQQRSTAVNRSQQNVTADEYI